MGRVVVTRHLLPGVLEGLHAHEVVQRPDDVPFTPAELNAAAAEADALVTLLTDRVDAAVLSAGTRLRVVANVAVGFDNIDLAAATEAGVLVCNTPGVLDETTADLAFALILAACRLTTDAERDLRAGSWTGFGFDRYLGVDAHGATLGLVGYGRIGRAVARRAAGFGMRVLHTTRTPTGDDGYVADLDVLLRASDIVSLHVPLSVETRGLIGARELAVMKPTGVLVNTSRGPIIDEDALADALERDALFGAGLDVYDDEPEVSARLLRAPRVTLLPHIGSATYATRRAMAERACASVVQVLAGELPPTALNPEVWKL